MDHSCEALQNKGNLKNTCTVPIGNDLTSNGNACIFKSPDQLHLVNAQKKRGAKMAALFNLEERELKSVQSKKALKKAVKVAPKQKASQKQLDDFRNFIGFWLRETKDDWIGFTAVNFFIEDDIPKVKFYNGTQNNLREINIADIGTNLDSGTSELFATPPIDYDTIVDTCDVEVINPTSVRIFNTLQQEGFLSSDQLTSTFKIQSYDNNIAYTQLWTNWDASSDDQNYGDLENLGRFKRLDFVPPIQTLNQPTVEWDNPINIFNYVFDAFNYLYMNQFRDAANCQRYIGNVAYQQLKEQMLTTGIVRTNKISTEKRVGKYVGVWTTKSTIAREKVTTLRLQDQNYFSNLDDIIISGFVGAYAPLNGIKRAAHLHKGSVGPYYGAEWVLPGSEIYTMHIQYDSSGILEEYDPNIHGVATLTATHGPVTSDIEYRPLINALYELISTLGSSTHTNLLAYVRADFTVIETYAELAEAMANNDFAILALRGLLYGQNAGRDLLYFNPVLNRGTRQSPILNINDPFNLGVEISTALPGSKWDYDIDINNYMVKSFNVWFAVTGPILPNEPITSQIEDVYGSNGSQVKFITSEVGVTPDPLVDEYGTHPYNIYQGNETGLFVGSIVNKCYTKKGKTVAYIRWSNTGGYDTDVILYSRTLVFGRNDMPGNKYISNEMAAIAALLETLNKYKPSKYVLDNRENPGGQGRFTSVFASFFGGNRASYRNQVFLDFANQPNSTILVNDSSIELANDSLDHNTTASNIINTDLAAQVFPNAMVRGSHCKPKDVVILTNLDSHSAGDGFPHNFIGSNKFPPNGINDIGYNVRAQIVGAIDGRIYSSASFNCTPISNPNPYKQVGIYDYPLVQFDGEGGIVLGFDEHGVVCNQQPWTRPSILVPSWYEKQWQDIGAIPIKYKYPLKRKCQVPNINDNTTWRDLALEYAIYAKS